MIHPHESDIPVIQKNLAFIHGENSEDSVLHLLMILASYPKTFLRVKGTIRRDQHLIERERRKVTKADGIRTRCINFDPDSGSCTKYVSGCFNCSDTGNSGDNNDFGGDSKNKQKGV